MAYHFKRWSYFRGDAICRQGDVNNTMYFILSGTITVIDEEKSIGLDQYVTELLNEKDCFGLVSIK